MSKIAIECKTHGWFTVDEEADDLGCRYCPPELTEMQEIRLRQLCERYSVPFISDNYTRAFDLPPLWVIGWVGPIYVGCSPEGAIHS